MKKLLSVCLLIALICSLCATGVSSFALSPEDSLDKYGSLIIMIESEDSDPAEAEYPSPTPAPEEKKPGREVIELTKDNFLDYFEFVYVESSYIERTSSGKIKEVSAGHYEFALKDEYKDRYSWESSEITVGVIAKLSSIYRAKINWETGKIKHGDKVSTDTRKAIKKDCSYATAKVDTQVSGYNSIYVCSAHLYYLYRTSYFKFWTTGWAEAGSNTKYYIDTWKAEVVNVSGTLILDPAT